VRCVVCVNLRERVDVEQSEEEYNTTEGDERGAGVKVLLTIVERFLARQAGDRTEVDHGFCRMGWDAAKLRVGRMEAAQKR
jgi:hypothetical protein